MASVSFLPGRFSAEQSAAFQLGFRRHRLWGLDDTASSTLADTIHDWPTLPDGPAPQCIAMAAVGLAGLWQFVHDQQRSPYHITLLQAAIQKTGATVSRLSREDPAIQRQYFAASTQLLHVLDLLPGELEENQFFYGAGIIVQARQLAAHIHDARLKARQAMPPAPPEKNRAHENKAAFENARIAMRRRLDHAPDNARLQALVENAATLPHAPTDTSWREIAGNAGIFFSLWDFYGDHFPGPRGAAIGPALLRKSAATLEPFVARRFGEAACELFGALTQPIFKAPLEETLAQIKHIAAMRPDPDSMADAAPRREPLP